MEDSIYRDMEAEFNYVARVPDSELFCKEKKGILDQVLIYQNRKHHQSEPQFAHDKNHYETHQKLNTSRINQHETFIDSYKKQFLKTKKNLELEQIRHNLKRNSVMDVIRHDNNFAERVTNRERYK